MNRRVCLSILLATIMVLAMAGLAVAAVKDDYQQGVASFKSLLANEKRAALRIEWQAVIKPFERVLAAQSAGEYAPRSMYFLGRSYEELSRHSLSKDDRAKALAMFDRMLASFPKHEWADDAVFRKGLIWQELVKDHPKAVVAFREVVSAYPDGDMVPEARKRLVALGGGKEASGAVKDDAAEKKVSSAPPAKKAATAVKSGSVLMGIRHWSTNEYTRVVMDVTKDVKYERNLLQTAAGGNKQLQITLQKTGVDPGVVPSRVIKDGILSRIDVGADVSGGALVTFDLMHMDHYRVFTLPDPYRIVLDIYGGGGKKEAPDQDAPSADRGHVQAALSDLQAKQAEQVPAKSDESKKQAELPPKNTQALAGGPAVPPSPTAPAVENSSTPEIQPSAKQKKYAGSLVEQLGLTIRTIMIDPGHGGKDPGAVANGVQEKDINLRMARIMGRLLQEKGFEVHYTRTGDRFIPLEERTAMANAKNADLFISLHCNAYKDESVNGLEIYYLNLATDAQAVRVAARENGVSAKKISDMQFILSDLMLNSKINESRQMAALVDQETMRIMRPNFGVTSHGSRGAFFYVLTGARMPSILVELGYVTNPTEAGRLSSDAYLTTLANGLVGGVTAYKKKLERFALQGPGKS